MMLGTVADAAGAQSPKVEALSLVQTMIPNEPCYQTSGSYPQLDEHCVVANEVNESIAKVFRNDERKWIAWGMSFKRRVDSKCPGEYEILNRPTTTFLDNKHQEFPSTYESASSRVISVLSTIQTSAPSGAGIGGHFVSITIDPSNSQTVELKQLFAKSSRAYAFIQELVIKRCVELRGSDDCSGAAQILPPKSSSFRYFALTTKGLAVGINGEVVSSWAWETTVPYSSLRPYLSTFGKWLVAGVRFPRLDQR